MITALYIVAAVIDAVGSLYLAWRYRDFRKFLAGAFFVSSGILFYLYLADVSVPLGNGLCRNAKDQCQSLSHSLQPVPDLPLFRVHQEGGGVKTDAGARRVGELQRGLAVLPPRFPRRL